MAVSLSVTGRLCTLDRRAEAVRFARERAADLEWRCEDVSYSFPAADVREGGRTRRVAPFRASGVVLLPHFACEPLPLLFADDEATLLDAYVHEGDDGRKTFEGGALVNTQFAGAAVHREICEFLTELQRGDGLHVPRRRRNRLVRLPRRRRAGTRLRRGVGGRAGAP